MTTYNALKTLIINNRYTYDDMYSKLDLFLTLDRITMDEYIELTGLLVKLSEPVKEIDS